MASPIHARARPKGAPELSHDIPVALLPALAQFRQARNTFDVFELSEEVPDHLLAQLAAHVASRSIYDREHVKELLRIVGFGQLAKHVGHQRARGLTARFFEQPNVSFV
ncbi:MAG: hypothetical protein P4L81_08210 [Candidatus Pacebacteria bacterium]|nr:hypothetical protein [Candidatus Paceibacterota bacterium]